MRVLTAILLAVTVAFVSCGRSRLNEVTVAGSTSIQPFAEMLAEDFMARNPGIRVMVQGGGSTAGVQAVREGAAQIGTVSRALNDQERDLMPIVIARDGIAVIVHPSNPVDNLTMEQVRGMFAGRTKEFPDTGARKCPVRPVTREEGSGTRGAFEELVMREDAITPRALVQDSNGSMREVVAHDPCAIGYISLGLVNDSVKALRIDEVAAAHENVKNGTYRLERPFLFALKTQPQGNVKAFVDFVLSDTAARLLEEEGLVAAR